MSRELLAPLEELQTIDLKIEELERQAAESPARIAELEGRANQARASADLERGRLAENERARRHQEHLLSEEKDKVKKWEARLPALKHPREFAALQREVEAAKKANANAEEELTRLREEAEGIKETLKAKEAERDSREAELEKELPVLKSAESELRGKVEALQADRNRFRGQVDRKLLATYDMLRRRRPGKALVETVKMCCTGCHRSMSPQLAYRLIAGAVEQCPSCQRLTYVRDEVPSESAAS